MGWGGQDLGSNYQAPQSPQAPSKPDAPTAPLRNTDLRLVRSAIKDDQGGIHSLPIPARHHQVIEAMRKAGYEGSVQGDRQGFLCSDGRFVGRPAAKRIAEQAGQLLQGKTIAATLTSEDLW